MRPLILLICLGWSTALAGDRYALPSTCRVESIEAAIRACIDHETDQVLERMDAEIVSATANLQAASGSQLRQFEKDLRSNQRNWKLRSDAECAARSRQSKVRQSICRHATALARLETLGQSLRDLQEQGGGSLALGPLDLDNIEVLVPLEVPGGPRFSEELRLPFSIPVSPD